jgi:hypothetical protein
MPCPFNPNRLQFKVRTVRGIELINPNELQIYAAVNDTCKSFSDWEEGQGFGSSDMTAATKECLDNLINITFKYDELKTDFTPYLSVVKK